MILKKIPIFLDHERFFSKINANSEDGCWVFNGAKNEHGYGRFAIKGKEYFAHRVSFSIFNGELKDGLVVDHKCRNRSCVNPEHLRQVTVRVNTIENSNSIQYLNSVKKKCVHGHDLDGENVYMYKGKRKCKECNRRRALNYYHNNKED